MEDRPQQTTVQVESSRVRNESRETEAFNKNKYYSEVESGTATDPTSTPVSSSSASPPTASRPVQSPTPDKAPPEKADALPANGAKIVYPRDAKTGEIIPVPMLEVGKASRFGDKTLGESNKCNVFEVVQQKKEATICPACARSPRKAWLPAYARGCFAVSYVQRGASEGRVKVLDDRSLVDAGEVCFIDTVR
ncbi:hypothetical protein K458DRAFT_411665 [Lentithecium fluviatile CBS 122367]|uniref:Uncharacterized protein n=1 Tax=Lentithecium fluviatile CBS 122367 TaxID=1168545 RepID=A0A6G1JPA1_9PLEO|nr:hypothetical protein K458DRAFT_411665 [Lentithecium fluviatile CBS 122367]